MGVEPIPEAPITVTRIRISSFGQHPGFSRALSLLLLVFVVYGTTIAAAHGHGRVLDATSNDLTASVSQPNSTSSLNGGQLGCSECVLCQFHQYSATALITIRAESSQGQTRIELLQPEPVSLKSQTSTPQKGRAPPLAN